MAAGFIYGTDFEEEPGIEDELSLPEDLQRLDLFEVVDGEFRLKRRS